MTRILLQVTAGRSDSERTVAITGQTLRLGRDFVCDLSFPFDATVSREHCSIDIGEDKITLRDSSSYGTRLNGNAVKIATLADGDLIEFGQGIAVRVVFDPQEEDIPSGDTANPVQDTSLAYLRPTESLGAISRATDQFPDPDLPIALQIHSLSSSLLGKIWKFPVEQSVTIGRSPACDICVATDPAVSRQHCRIAYDAGELTLESEGTHGCSLNGNPVETAVLEDGDEIAIGIDTRLRVTFIYPGGEFDDDSFDTEGSIHLAREKPVNGLSICRTNIPKGGNLVTVLTELCPDHHPIMILDRLKAGVEVQGEIAREQYILCDHYPIEVLPQISPIFASPDVWAKPEFMEDISGSDAYLMVMSQPSAKLDEVISHFRQLADLNPQTGRYSQGQTLFAYWWPSMLENVCRNCPAAVVNELLKGVDVIAYEVEDGAAVELVSSEDFTSTLMSMSGVRVRDSVYR